MSRKSATMATALLVLAVAAIAAAEQEAPSQPPAAAVSEEPPPLPDYSGDLWQRRWLTGNWDGSRDALAAKGIQADIQWTQTLQSVVSGGRDTATRYGGSVDYNLMLDLQRMNVLPGAVVAIRAESRYGESVNDRAGTILPVNIDGLFPLSRTPDEDIAITVTKLSYTQFLSEQFGVTLGKFDTLDGDANEFASGRGVSQFMNSNLIFSAPLSLSTPYSTIGGGVIFIPNDQWTIASLAYTTSDSSTTTGFSDVDEGWTWSTEAQFQYRLGGLPGGANAGFVYAFDNEFLAVNDRFTFAPGQGIVAPTEDETWTVYASGWQYLYMKGEAPAGRVDLTDGRPDYEGLGAFGRLAFADDDTNPVELFLSVGLGGRGLIPTREYDLWGIGYYYMDIQQTRIGGILGVEDESQGFEAFYNLALTPASQLTFDLQVVDSPSPGLDPAVALALRLNLRF